MTMDAAFWDLDVPSPQTLNGTARRVPGEFFPISAACLSRNPRPLQLCFLRNGFPLGIIPAVSPTSPNEIGSFALQSLLAKYVSSKWWVGLVGQFRPKIPFAKIKEVAAAEVKGVMRHFYNKSLYALGLYTQVSLTSTSDLYYMIEGHGEKGHRSKATYFHELPHHDVTLEAAWPELFIDKNGSYWDVPASISLDLASVSDSGLGYRFGIHKFSGDPNPLSQTCGDVPSALMPGLYAKAALSYQKSLDFWRVKEKSQLSKTKRRRLLSLNYDACLKEPHASISGIVGGTCTALLGGRKNSGDNSGDGIFANNFTDLFDSVIMLRDRIVADKIADLFGSVGFSLQRGGFKKKFGDLTRIDARLDICSATELMKGLTRSEENPLAIPQLNMIFQQQVVGPLLFRVDSKLSPSTKRIAVDDFVYSLSCSLRHLEGGKVIAWYSTKRKEGMIELRMYEFLS